MCWIVSERRRVLVGQLQGLANGTPTKKAVGGSEIPTPQSLVVESYERDYKRTFVQPQSYIRARPGELAAPTVGLFPSL